MDYAGAVTTERGRCFRMIHDDYGRPTHCPKPPLATGWTQIGSNWYPVDACGEHSAQLLKRGPYRPSADPSAN